VKKNQIDSLTPSPLQEGGFPLFEKEESGEILGKLNSSLLCRPFSYHKGKGYEIGLKKFQIS